MTIITGTEYRANQGKYNKRALEGERVVISSHGGYVELKPVSKDDKDVMEFFNAKSFLAVSSVSQKDFPEDKYTTLKSHEDIVNWFNSL